MYAYILTYWLTIVGSPGVLAMGMGDYNCLEVCEQARQTLTQSMPEGMSVQSVCTQRRVLPVVPAQ